MESETLGKIFENEIIANIKQRNLTPLELAHLIDEYMSSQMAKGVKLSEIEEKLGISKRVLYKYKSILKLPKETIDKFQDKLSFEQMSIVAYSVKDKSKIPEVLEEVAARQIPSNELVYEVAEINDKSKIAKHIISEIQRHKLWVIGLKARILRLPREDQKRIREELEDLAQTLNEV